MRIISLLVALAIGAIAAFAAPPNFTYLFNATVNIGELSKPIPVPGGLQIGQSLLKLSVSFPCTPRSPLPPGFAQPLTCSRALAWFLQMKADVLFVVEPLTGGTIHGPALNGTLSAGTGHPIFYNNMTLMVNEIDSPGITDDGNPFFVHEVGLGPLDRQISRLVGHRSEEI